MKIICPKHGEIDEVVFTIGDNHPRCKFCDDDLWRAMNLDPLYYGPTIYIDEAKKRRFNIKKKEE